MTSLNTVVTSQDVLTRFDHTLDATKSLESLTSPLVQVNQVPKVSTSRLLVCFSEFLSFLDRVKACPTSGGFPSPGLRGGHSKHVYGIRVQTCPGQPFRALFVSRPFHHADCLVPIHVRRLSTILSPSYQALWY